MLKLGSGSFRLAFSSDVEMTRANEKLCSMQRSGHEVALRRECTYIPGTSPGLLSIEPHRDLLSGKEGGWREESYWFDGRQATRQEEVQLGQSWTRWFVSSSESLGKQGAVPSAKICDLCHPDS